MMRSFSKGNNFPTEYPHFGGQDVKYHFMFQFLVGNLEFLGIRLDFAYNIESVLALLGFLMLLYSIAKLEPLAQLPDALPDDLHHQHIGTAGPAQGKRFLRL